MPKADYLVFNWNLLLAIGIKRKYKFQWMRADNSLIMRWDNAEHHRTIHINNAVKSGKLLYRDAYKLTSLKGDTFEIFFNEHI